MVMARVGELVHRVKWVSEPNRLRGKTYCGVQFVTQRQGPDDDRPIGAYVEGHATCLECGWRTNPV